MRLGRIERVRPAVEFPGRSVVSNEVAALELGILAELRRDRSAGGHRQDPVRLLEAELRPGLVLQVRSAGEQYQVVPCRGGSSSGPYTAVGSPGSAGTCTSAP